jgi:hypothetical protein
MKLWIINITLENIQQPVQLMFNIEEQARTAYQDLIERLSSPGSELLVDGYGRSLVMKRQTIAAVLLSDYALELSGRQEVAILEAHAQHDFQRRAASDEKLRRAGASIQPANGPLPGMPFQRN